MTVLGFNLRCHRLGLRAREVIESGELGEIHQVITVWGSPMQHDPAMPEWRRRIASGGGALFDMGVHQIDFCAFLLRDRIATVQMLSRSGACEHENISLLGRTSGGVLISSAFSQLTAPANEIRIMGDKGILSFSLYRADSFELSSLDRPSYGLGARLRRLRRVREIPELLRIARGGGDYVISYRRQWEQFAQAIRGEGEPASSFVDGLTALRVMEAAMESEKSGTAVVVANS